MSMDTKKYEPLSASKMSIDLSRTRKKILDGSVQILNESVDKLVNTRSSEEDVKNVKMLYNAVLRVYDNIILLAAKSEQIESFILYKNESTI